MMASPECACQSSDSTPSQAGDVVALDDEASTMPVGAALRSPEAIDDRVAVRVEGPAGDGVGFQEGNPPPATIDGSRELTVNSDPEHRQTPALDTHDSTIRIDQLSFTMQSPNVPPQIEPDAVDVTSVDSQPAGVTQVNTDDDGVTEDDDARDAPCVAVDVTPTANNLALGDIDGPGIDASGTSESSSDNGAVVAPAPVPKPSRSDLCGQPSSGYFPANDLHRRSKGSLTVMCEIRRDGQRIFLPASINVTVGDAVLFRWFKRDDLVQVDNSGRPMLDAKFNSRLDPYAPLPSEHYVQFSAPGRFRFESLEFPGQLRAQISVSERSGTLRYYVLRVLGVAAIVFAVVTSITSAFVESSKTSYYVADPHSEDGAALRLIEDVVKEKALPWIVAGIVFLLLVLLARVFFCCITVRLNDYGRGFLEHQQRGSQIFSMAVAFIILLAVAMSWVTYIKLSFGLSTLIGVILDHVRDLLNEAVAVSVDVRFMLKTTPSASTSSGLELLASVDETSETIRQWADVGEELVSAALRLVTAFVFIALHVYLLAACALLAGVRRRRASLMNAGFWIAIVGTVAIGLTIGVNAVVADVLDRTRLAADGFAESTLTTQQAQNLTGAGEESALVKFLVSCSANGSFSVDFLEERVANSVDQWNQGAPPSLAFPDYDFTNSSGIRNLNVYMDDIVRQVAIIEASLASNASLLSRSLQSDFSADLLPTLQASVRVARTLLLLIDCGILRRIFRDIVPVLDDYVIHVHRDLSGADFWLLSAVLLAIVVAAVTAYVFDRPYKFWYEPQTGRWFRFRSCFLAHRRLLMKDFMGGSRSMLSTSMAPHLSSFHTSMRRSFRFVSSVDGEASVVDPVTLPEPRIDGGSASGPPLVTTIPQEVLSASPLVDSSAGAIATGPAPLLVNGAPRATVPWPEHGTADVAKSPKWQEPSSCNRAGVFSCFYQAALLAGLMLLGEGALLVALHRSYEHNRLALRLLAAASCCTVFPLVSYAANEIDHVLVRVVGRVFCFLLAAVAFVLLAVNADDQFDRASVCAERNQEARKTGNSTALIVVTEGCGVDATFQMTEQAIYSTVVAITCAVAVLASAVLVVFARRRVGDFLVVVVGESGTNAITVIAMRHRYLKWRQLRRCQEQQLRYADGTQDYNSPVLPLGPMSVAADVRSASDAQEVLEDDAKLAFDVCDCAEREEGFTAEDHKVVAEFTQHKRLRHAQKVAKWTMALVMTAAVIALVVVALLPDAQNDGGISSEEISAETAPIGCNGDTLNCNRRIDEMVWLTTHNSFSALEDDFVGPNHYFGMRQQLSDGVRAFMIDIYNYTDPDTGAGVAALCHGDCRVGVLPLSTALQWIEAFLTMHPTDVLIFIVEQVAADEIIADAMRNSTLESKMWISPNSSSDLGADFVWPTLNELTGAGVQLMWFTDTRALGDGNFDRSVEAPWMLYMWDFMFETPFSVNTTAGFGCDRQVRGNSTASFDGRLAVLNHFLTDLLGAPYLAAQANPTSVVNRHFYGCQGQWGSLPQLLAVDFYSISDTLSQADSLNTLARSRA